RTSRCGIPAMRLRFPVFRRRAHVSRLLSCVFDPGKNDPLSRSGNELMPRHLYLILVVWLLMVGGGPSAEPGEKDAAANELAKLQGKWKLVAEDLDGQLRKFNDGHVIGFDKDININYDADGGVAAKATIKLDQSKSPKAIDLTVTFNVLFPNE